MTAPAPTTADRTRRFREAMASFPSGVTIVTTADATGRWWGFTATSFCSVSMDPPLVLTCLAQAAECFPVFERARRWVVHVIHPDHAELAMRFATRGADKFADAGFVADGHGLPVLESACTRLFCTAHGLHSAGDHAILLGEVHDVQLGEGLPAVYFRRSFQLLTPCE